MLTSQAAVLTQPTKVACELQLPAALVRSFSLSGACHPLLIDAPS